MGLLFYGTHETKESMNQTILYVRKWHYRTVFMEFFATFHVEIDIFEIMWGGAEDPIAYSRLCIRQRFVRLRHILFWSVIFKYKYLRN